MVTAITPNFTTPPSPQASSAFLTHLPLELRNRIYTEFWRLSGLQQHISNGPSHTPCVTDTSPRAAADTRYQSLGAAPAGSDEQELWTRRCHSAWALHWACEEASAADRAWSPFLPVLLTCRQFHAEALASMLERVTFILTDTQVANDFLTTWPHAPRIHSLSLVLRLDASVTDLYSRPAGPNDPPHNSWETLCTTLSTLASPSGVRDLKVWIDAADTRMWHSFAPEHALFKSLLAVKVLSFLLELPSIPEDVRAEKAGQFLLGGGMGCRVDREGNRGWIVREERLRV